MKISPTAFRLGISAAIEGKSVIIFFRHWLADPAYTTPQALVVAIATKFSEDEKSDLERLGSKRTK